MKLNKKLQRSRTAEMSSSNIICQEALRKNDFAHFGLLRDNQERSADFTYRYASAFGSLAGVTPHTVRDVFISLSTVCHCSLFHSAEHGTRSIWASLQSKCTGTRRVDLSHPQWSREIVAPLLSLVSSWLTVLTEKMKKEVKHLLNL